MRYAGQKGLLAEGLYDVKVQLKVGTVKATEWIRPLQVSGETTHTVDFDIPIATLRLDIKNNGKNANYDVKWRVYAAGDRVSPLNNNLGGSKVAFRQGTYDIGVFFKKGNVRANRWLLDQPLSGNLRKTIDVGADVADLLVHVVENGKELKGGYCRVYRPLEDERATTGDTTDERVKLIGGTFSGQLLPIAPGRYHLVCSYGQTGARGEAKVENLTIEELTEITVDLTVSRIDMGKITIEGEGVDGKGGEIDLTVPPEEDLIADKNNGHPAELPTVISSGELTLPKLQGDAVLGRGGQVSLKISLSPKNNTDTSVAHQTVDNELARIELILDSSGSMAGKLEGATKMSIAQNVLGEVVDDLPSTGLQVALRVYGADPKKRKNCEDSKLAVPFGKIDKDALQAAIRGATPSGYTPLSYSLERAAEDLSPHQNSSLVIVTDGIESCGGDPCKTAARLAAEGVFTRSFIVGFGVEENERQFLECIGTYIPAKDRSQLRNALKGILAISQRPTAGKVTVFELGSRERIVATGALGDLLLLPRGKYDIVIRVGKKTIEWKGREIVADTEETVP